MTPVAVTVAVLAAAVLHAGWNALLKGTGDRLATVVLLDLAYRAGDLSQVYPLARGTAPLLVAGYAGLVLGERLAPAQLLGLAGVCAGLLALVEVGRGPGRAGAAVGPALATGVLIAAYTVADG